MTELVSDAVLSFRQNRLQWRLSRSRMVPWPSPTKPAAWVVVAFAAPPREERNDDKGAAAVAGRGRSDGPPFSS